MSMRVDASTSYLPPEPTLPVPTRTRSEAQENAPAGLGELARHKTASASHSVLTGVLLVAERPLVIQTPFLDQALSCLPQLQSQTTGELRPLERPIVRLLIRPQTRSVRRVAGTLSRRPLPPSRSKPASLSATDTSGTGTARRYERYE